ncbi:MAG: flippase-like domain-containing protein [Clostridia bacterium]|nr:flippase-like domain-containing protein [Clostridia bacterium]
MAIRESILRMRKDIKSAYKSEDTEEFFDRIFTKPLGYLWARFFIHIGWTPNMVTILSMGIGFVGGLLFYPENFLINLIGVLLVVWANILDSTDGQMARLTGIKSTLGRILDALSTSVWYVAIYVSLCLRLMNDPIAFMGGRTWSGWIWVIAVVCAIFGHERQCMMADYFRNAHLFFLKNKHGSELDSTREIARLRASLPWKGARFQKTYLFFYGIYTYIQELTTPNFQRLMAGFQQADASIKERVRQEYLEKSRKYIQLTNILTFNARAYTLFACLLLGVPILIFPIELILFGLLQGYMIRNYERIAAETLENNRLSGYDTPPAKRKRYPVFFFAVGVLGVILLLAKTDLNSIDWSGILSTIYIWLPALIALWAVIYLLHSAAYASIMGKDSKKIPFFQLFKVVISGFAINHVTPVGMVGGEPYRIMELKPYIGTEKATAATLTFTIMHTFSHFMYWLTGAIVFLFMYFFSVGAFPAIIAIIIALLGIFLCAMFLKSGKNGLALYTLTLLSRIPLLGKPFARLIENKRETLESIDREMSLFRVRKRDFFATTIIEFLTRMLEPVEFYIIFRLLGVDISYFACVVALACASLLGNLMFFVPMQVGSREAGLALALSWSSVASPFGVTASLLARLREIFYIALGVIAMLIKGSTGTAKETDAKTDAAVCESETPSETEEAQ